MFGKDNLIRRRKRKSKSKWHFRIKFLTFLAQKDIFSEIFWDLSGLFPICKKKFQNLFLTPPPLKLFVYLPSPLDFWPDSCMS
jgi:hypothetical protein